MSAGESEMPGSMGVSKVQLLQFFYSVNHPILFPLEDVDALDVFMGEVPKPRYVLMLVFHGLVPSKEGSRSHVAEVNASVVCPLPKKLVTE